MTAPQAGSARFSSASISARPTSGRRISSSVLIVEWKQLEDGIARRDRRERLGRRAGRHGEVALSGRPETIQVSAQDGRLADVGDGAQPESPDVPPALERHLAGRFAVPHPLGPSTRRDEKARALELDHVDGGGEQTARLPPAHLQDIVIARAEAQSYQRAEGAVERSL